MLLVVQVVEETGETPGRFILAEPPGIRPHDRLHRHHVLDEVGVFCMLVQDRPALISRHSWHPPLHPVSWFPVYLITYVDYTQESRYSDYTMLHHIVNKSNRSMSTLRYTVIPANRFEPKSQAKPGWSPATPIGLLE